MKSFLLESILLLCFAPFLAHCASVQSDGCPVGERLAASGNACEPIECNGGELQGNLCVCPAGQILDEVTCRDQGDPCIGLGCNDGNSCTADNCAAGSCTFDPTSDGEPCSVGDLAGVCLAGVCDDDPCASIDCSDRNPCTVDATCNPSNARCEGLRDEADGTSCDFGDFPGVCMSGGCEDAMLCADVDCDDTNPCTDDVCDRLTGVCSNPPLDELSPCEVEGVLGECMSEVCVGLCEDEVTRCNDGSACTTDTCDPETGCVNTEKNCSDNNSCTSDDCLPSTGACVNTNRSNGSRCTLPGTLIPGECDNGVCKSLIIIDPPFPPIIP